MNIRRLSARVAAGFLVVFAVNPAGAEFQGLPDTEFCVPSGSDPTGEKVKEYTKSANVNLGILQTQIGENPARFGKIHEQKSKAYESYLECMRWLQAMTIGQSVAKLDADLVVLLNFFEKKEAVPEVRLFMLSELLYKQAETTKDAASLGALRKRLKSLIADGVAMKIKPEKLWAETDDFRKLEAERVKEEKQALVSDLMANAAGVAALAGDVADAKAMLNDAITRNGKNTEAHRLLGRLDAPKQAQPVADVQLNYEFVGHKLKITSEVEFSPDGTRLLVLSSDDTYREWDWMAGKIARFGTPPKPVSEIMEIGYLPDLDAFYAIGETLLDGTEIKKHHVALEVWDPGGQSVNFVSTALDFDVPAKTGFIVRKNADNVTFIDPDDGAEIRAIELSFTGKFSDNIGRTVSKKGLRHRGGFEWIGDKAPLSHFLVSGDGAKFVETGFPAESVVGFGETQTGKVKKVLQQEYLYPTFSWYKIAITDSGSNVAVSNPETLAVELIDTKSGKLVATLRGNSDEVYDMQFSDDERTLVTRSKDDRVIFWDAVTGKKNLELPKFKNYVLDFDFSPNGKYLATVGYDGSSRIWEVTTGKLMLTLYAIEKEQVASASGLALLPSGRFVANGVGGPFLMAEEKPLPMDEIKLLSYGQALPADLFTP